MGDDVRNTYVQIAKNPKTEEYRFFTGTCSEEPVCFTENGSDASGGMKSIYLCCAGISQFSTGAYCEFGYLRYCGG
jgi:hypothetical protein